MQYLLRIILIAVISCSAVFPVRSLHAAACEIYTLKQKSEIFEDRGRWSVGPYDYLVDLAGEWEVAGEPDSTIFTPFAWNICQEQIEVRRTFQIPAEYADYHCRLVVDGACQAIRIALNNVNVDRRRSSDASFQVNLNSRLLQFGSRLNVISVTLDNQLSRNKYPPLQGSIFTKQHYGGIKRGIYLVISPPRHLVDVTCMWDQESDSKTGNPNSRESGSAATSTFLEINAEFEQSQFAMQTPGAQDPSQFLVTLIDPTGQVISRTDSLKLEFNTGNVQRKLLRIPLLNPQFSVWKQKTEFYRVQVELINSQDKHLQTTKCGLRSLTFDETGFSINSQSVQLKCLNLISSDPLYGPMIPDEILKTDLNLIKDLGVDAIRINQGLATTALLELCDEYGIIVFEELPVFQVPDGILSGESFISAAIDQARELIQRHRRYSCIAAWGIGSEINPPNYKNLPYYQNIVSAIRQLDNRPVYVSVPFTESFTSREVDFAILELRIETATGITAIPLKMESNLPFFVGGIRQLIKPGNPNGWEDPTSEAAQAHSLVAKLEALEQVSWVRGIIVGDYTDWKGSTPSISSPLQGSSSVYHSGLVTQDRKTRLAYRYLKEYWSDRQVHSLSGGVAERTDSALLIAVGLLMIALLLYATRSNNIFRFNIGRTFTSPRSFFQDVSDLRYFQSSHTLLLAVLISSGIGLIGAGWFYSHRTSYEVDWVIGYLIGSPRILNWVATLFWQPLRAFLFWWLVGFGLLWIGTFQSVFISSFYRRKASITQNFDYIVWSSIVMLGLLPLGIVAARLYGSNGGWVVNILSLIMIVWSFLRLIWVYQHHIRRSVWLVIGLWMILPVVLSCVLFFSMQYFRSFYDYFGFIAGTLLGFKI